MTTANPNRVTKRRSKNKLASIPSTNRMERAQFDRFRWVPFSATADGLRHWEKFLPDLSRFSQGRRKPTAALFLSIQVAGHSSPTFGEDHGEGGFRVCATGAQDMPPKIAAQ